MKNLIQPLLNARRLSARLKSSSRMGVSMAISAMITASTGTKNDQHPEHP
jgi:hypothetical protein